MHYTLSCISQIAIANDIFPFLNFRFNFLYIPSLPFNVLPCSGAHFPLSLNRHSVIQGRPRRHLMYYHLLFITQCSFTTLNGEFRTKEGKDRI